MRQYIVDAFTGKEGSLYRLRWFTPKAEVDLCGHATLATAYELDAVPVSEAMRDALGVMPEAAYMGRNLLCVLNSEDDVRNCVPDFAKVSLLDGLLLHITAKGHDGIDCVSRSFAPKIGINEDPVCGSGHCHIVPYWAEKLGRKDITAYQASERGGYLYCRDEGKRVIISSKAALYSRSDILEDA